MKLTELLREDLISVDLQAADKESVIEELVGILVKAGGAKDRDAVIKAVHDREELMSTGIGQGIGIPHAKTEAVERLVAVFGKSERGVDFNALDNKPVHIFFLLLSPEDQSGPHVKVLARISRLLKHSDFRQALLDAKSSKEVMDIIREEELKHF